MPLTPEQLPGLQDSGWSLLAAVAGRALLLARVTRESLTWRKVLVVLTYEVPLIGGCAVFGAFLCDAVGISGSMALVVIGILGNKGPALLDPVLEAVTEALVSAVKRVFRG